MTDDQIRVDFEAHIAKLNAGKSGLNSSLERDYTGAYEKSWVQLGWLYWQAATMKATQVERERAIAACQVRAAAGKKARNTQYQVGCSECIDAIRLALSPIGTEGNHG